MLKKVHENDKIYMYLFELVAYVRIVTYVC